MKNKDSILVTILVVVALVVTCTSCSVGRRGMTNCDFTQKKMCGYMYKGGF